MGSQVVPERMSHSGYVVDAHRTEEKRKQRNKEKELRHLSPEKPPIARKSRLAEKIMRICVLGGMLAGGLRKIVKKCASAPIFV